MSGATFQQLSAPPSWGSVGLIVYGGKGGDVAAQPGIKFNAGHGWFGVSCPSAARQDCIPPKLNAPVSPVPEASGALMLAAGLVAVWLWIRKG